MHRVFIVEDHPIVRESLEELFAFESEFECVGSAESALDALEALAGTEADLIVTDISLPGPSGLDLTRTLREQYPHLRVLVVSGHQDRIYAEQAREAGAHGFVTKTALVSDLIPALQGIARGVTAFD
jgi:DNA-binding NarL/FixJ family response regulator